MKKRLFTPGPTPVPEQVMLAMSEPIIHHRQPEFKELFRRVSENLQYLFQTNLDVYTFTSSGTGAMEAAVCNLLSAGDTALFVNDGKFGERWGQLCSGYGVKAEEIAIDWGNVVRQDQVSNMLKKFPKAKAIFVTHSETSTGVVTDVRSIANIVRKDSDAVLVVDGISSVGVLELRMDDWGIDVLLTGSQKGLMIPPGLAFLAMSDRARKLVEHSHLPKYYFSLTAATKSFTDSETPWTPAITLFVGLDVALQMIRSEGIENVWGRHERLARAIRAGCEALQLTLFTAFPSNALTAVRVPAAISAEELLKHMKDRYGITIAGGQGHLKGKIFRIAHLGFYDELDAVAVISGLEEALRSCGWNGSSGTLEPGAGVRAVQRELQAGMSSRTA
ncbi:MAG: alanine--glyoxylate aminotransferase family protein [Bacteroidota bacterium]